MTVARLKDQQRPAIPERLLVINSSDNDRFKDVTKHTVPEPALDPLLPTKKTQSMLIKISQMF